MTLQRLNAVQAAALQGVNPPTARKWIGRYLAGGCPCRCILRPRQLGPFVPRGQPFQALEMPFEMFAGQHEGAQQQHRDELMRELKKGKHMARFFCAACLALALALTSAWAQVGPSDPIQRKRQVLSRDDGRTTASAPAAAGTLTPFVDAHVHLNSLPLQLELMERWGATRAVVFWGGRSSNESVAEATRQHPGVFIPFASISPERTAYRPHWEQPDGDDLLTQLHAMLATGLFKGIGEISIAHFPSDGFPETDFAVNGPMMTGIMELARKHKVPVLVHVESTRMPELSKLLNRFADVPVIWAHGGYTPLFLARRMLEQHPNLYYELSARTWPYHPRSPDYTILRDGERVWPDWLRLVESMPDRFLVGTDASHRSASSDDMKYSSVQNFLAQLSPPTRRQVARLTLMRLVGLPLE